MTIRGNIWKITIMASIIGHVLKGRRETEVTCNVWNVTSNLLLSFLSYD